MPFHYEEPLRDDYHSAGLVVLRDLIPSALLVDLRRESDIARVVARKRFGAQCQRLQPVYAFEEVDPKPFRAFLALDGLRATVEGILGNGHESTDNMGILLEPAELAWATNWHRDWGHHVQDLDMDRFYAVASNHRVFNQLNAALWDDDSLWVVPGSHDRPDTPGEAGAFDRIPAPGPELREEMTPTEREAALDAYVTQMPGATQVRLGVGDVAFYRASGWHLGRYRTDAPRATLHDGFYCDDDRAWREEMKAHAAATKK